VIVSTAVFCPPSAAVMVAEVVEPTREVEIGKVALVCPSGMITLLGTVAEVVLLERNAADPPGGEGMLRVTVPTDEAPPLTDEGLSASEETASAVGAGPHMPSAPQTPPPGQPQAMVPPQPSGAEHWLAGMSKQLFGVQPAVTVSGFVTGAWPAAELALTVTVLVCEI
jgi:hypothetical protein